ncbi:LexA family transcriptional regulator [Cupriavidus gilardii]|uniref:Helix-turn-helix transcriptional regulator n=2 Tax=Cupriavidus gilardii TaxID=82541 RepID=A0A849BDU7_9BURK|nr:helix-turn-helix transcriptional regulator [Cupriavidus gilardii]KAB0597765.1 helix-turn-helix transcriptional regulator [Cupriavidus gilardii]NNH14070.1 helix-turn-helix transcriptional regulator [Cupriavidus gilardii]
MTFNGKSNTTFINETFTRENIRAMHETMVRLYEAARKLKGLETPTEVARVLNQSQQTINNWERRGISQRGMLKAQAEIGCSATWLQTGTPPMVAVKLPNGAIQIEETLNENSVALAYNPLPSPTTLAGVVVRPIVTYESLEELPKESTVLVTRIDVELSAGSGREAWHIEEREPLPFQADYIRRLDAKPKNLVAVKVNGDSMEPRLFHDDTVIVDRADTRVPANGGVFALVYAGELLVKRLFRLPDGGLRVVSDNHERYEPIMVAPEHTEHISIIGRVKYRSGVGDF